MNRNLIETPFSKISVIDLKTARGYNDSFLIICHIRDRDSAVKTLNWIIEKRLKGKNHA